MDWSLCAVAVAFQSDVAEQLGNVSYLYSQRDQGESLVAEWRGLERPAAGSHVSLWVSPADCYLFETTGARL